MPAFVADLPAARVDAALRESLRELRAAERSSVLYFAEIMNRRLYRELGYATIRQYAVDRLQFSPSKTGYFIQLAVALKRLPKTRASVARGELPWTKAAEVVKVATPRTEGRWLDVARSSGRRDLAEKVKRARGVAVQGGEGADLFSAMGVSAPVVPALVVPASVSVSVPSRSESAREASLPEVLPPAATDVRFRFSSEQRGRFEAMIEKLRKLGEKGDRTELVLQAMALLVLERTEAKHYDRTARPAAVPDPLVSTGVDGAASPERASRLVSGNPNPHTAVPGNTPRVHSPRAQVPVYQVYVRSCEQCDRGWLETTNGSQLLDAAALHAILCDCRVSRPGEPNQHAIPPRLRRRALERDGYRCRARGCGSHRFLNVHHMHARADGPGPTEGRIASTICSRCATRVTRWCMDCAAANRLSCGNSRLRTRKPSGNPGNSPQGGAALARTARKPSAPVGFVDAGHRNGGRRTPSDRRAGRAGSRTRARRG